MDIDDELGGVLLHDMVCTRGDLDVGLDLSASIRRRVQGDAFDVVAAGTHPAEEGALEDLDAVLERERVLFHQE